MITENLKGIEVHCRKILNNELPNSRCFHNLRHTENVVKAVEIIGKSEGIKLEDQNVLTIAAWFHDLGYVNAYENHEAASINLACDYLNTINCSENIIQQVATLIGATRPQSIPKSQLEKIMCDADHFHLAAREYWTYNQLLQHELIQCQHLAIDEKQWLERNLQFLKTHTYYTNYGQKHLEPLKQQHISENIKLLKTA